VVILNAIAVVLGIIGVIVSFAFDKGLANAGSSIGNDDALQHNFDTTNLFVKISGVISLVLAAVS
jgi:hypothetical protein